MYTYTLSYDYNDRGVRKENKTIFNAKDDKDAIEYAEHRLKTTFFFPDATRGIAHIYRNSPIAAETGHRSMKFQSV